MQQLYPKNQKGRCKGISYALGCRHMRPWKAQHSEQLLGAPYIHVYIYGTWRAIWKSTSDILFQTEDTLSCHGVWEPNRTAVFLVSVLSNPSRTSLQLWSNCSEKCERSMENSGQSLHTVQTHLGPAQSQPPRVLRQQPQLS